MRHLDIKEDTSKHPTNVDYWCMTLFFVADLCPFVEPLFILEGTYLCAGPRLMSRAVVHSLNVQAVEAVSTHRGAFAESGRGAEGRLLHP